MRTVERFVLDEPRKSVVLVTVAQQFGHLRDKPREQVIDVPASNPLGGHRHAVVAKHEFVPVPHLRGRMVSPTR